MVDEECVSWAATAVRLAQVGERCSFVGLEDVCEHLVRDSVPSGQAGDMLVGIPGSQNSDYRS